MKREEIIIQVIEPEEGMILTNGDVYSDKVYLGVNDSVDNWTEVPITDLPETE